MADFNAGSIEGTLDLDTTPFASGLRKAQAEAANFERKRIDASVGLDTADFTLAKDRVDLELDDLGAKEANPKVELNGVQHTLFDIGLVKMALNAVQGSGSGLLSIVGSLFSRITLLGTGFITLGAAAIPATAAVAGFGAAAAVAFGGAALSLGLFAKVVTSDFATIQKAVKSGTQLAGAAGMAETAFKHLTKAWHEFQKAAGNPGFRFLATVFNGVAGVLPMLVPLLHTTAHGMTGVVKQVLALAHTKTFDQFLKSLQGFMHGFLKGLGPVLSDALTTFMNLFTALQPLIDQLGGGIKTVADNIAKWSSGPGLTNFVKYVQQNLPLVESLFHNVWGALKNVFGALKPLARPALKVLRDLFGLLGKIDFTPITKGLKILLHGLDWLIKHPAVAAIIAGIAGAIALIVQPETSLAAVVGLIIGLGTAFHYAYTHSKTFRDIMHRIGHIISADVVPMLKQMWHWFETKIVPAIKQDLTPVLHTFGHVLKKDIIPNVEKFLKAIKPWVPIIEKVVGWVLKLYWALDGKLLQTLIQVAGYMMGAEILGWAMFIQWVGKAVKAVGNFASEVGKDIGKVVEWFKKLPGRIESFVSNMVSAGKKFFGGVFTGIKDVGAEIIQWCKDLPGRVIAAIGNIGSQVASNVKSSISGALSGIGGFIGGLIPHHATGGVTLGPHLAMVGDNPGGREAIIPLNEFDLPKRGDAARSQAQAARAEAAARAQAQRHEQFLARIEERLRESNALMQELLGKTGTLDQPTLKRLQQAVRAT